MIIAADRKQARTILRFILGLLEQSPMLVQLIEAQTRESVTLRNRINIEIHTASFRSTRGYTIVAALLDELAFWPAEDSAQPDEEVIAAIRPGMATVPGAMLLCASSPHARRGALWQAYKNYFGKADSPVLVWQAPTRAMNPNVPQAWIDAEIERDPGKNTAEYLAQFRTDLEAYVRREAVEACITPKILVRLPQPGVVYHGFVDPSGGSADEMTLAIAHYDRARQMVVIDALHWFTPPFSPVTVVSKFARILKTYRVHKIVGDRYAGEWPREQFAKFGIRYEPSTKSKSELNVDLLPLINSARIELLDQPRAINQLLALERRTARGGRESIDHPAGGHDDLINAIAGAAVSAVSRYASFDTSLAWVSGPDDNTAPERSYAAQRLSAYIRAHERFF